MNILVTGATGFIGSSLVERLAGEGGHKIYAIVRKTSKVDFLKKLGVNLIFADLADYIPGLSSLYNPGMEMDAVFHCAGYVNDRDWDRLYKVNVIFA